MRIVKALLYVLGSVLCFLASQIPAHYLRTGFGIQVKTDVVREVVVLLLSVGTALIITVFVCRTPKLNKIVFENTNIWFWLMPILILLAGGPVFSLVLAETRQLPFMVPLLWYFREILVSIGYALTFFAVFPFVVVEKKKNS